MKIRFDLHTHTNYSHGIGSVSDNFNVAKSKNLFLGIADHGPGHVYYGVHKDGMILMKQDIVEIKKNNPASVLLQGIEANLMGKDGRCDIDELETPEYILMGFHKGIFPKSALSVSLYAKKFFSKNRAVIVHTDAIIRAIEQYEIDAITHPGEYIPVDIRQLSNACAEKGVLFEINNSHLPSVDNLITACESGVHFLLSSDAHQSKHVGCVENAIEVAKKANISEDRIVNTEAFLRSDISNNGLRIMRLSEQLFQKD